MQLKHPTLRLYAKLVLFKPRVTDTFTMVASITKHPICITPQKKLGPHPNISLLFVLNWFQHATVFVEKILLSALSIKSSTEIVLCLSKLSET